MTLCNFFIPIGTMRKLEDLVITGKRSMNPEFRCR